ncbi:MAG: DUF2865 domain-containing protein [Hoeflea sp.]|uniref:DUF2865 domain-containing protein n=1 Tax=Hoeflea sp. TaxID=1940281 RepID=UPI0032EFC9E4
MRRILFHSTVIAFAAALGSAGTTHASDVCTSLRTQLASASQNTGSSSNYHRYAEAVVKQTQQLRKVRADLSQNGCTSGSFIVIGGENTKTCAKLSAAQTKMRANLAALERKRDSYAGHDSKAAARRIQAALKANDCDGSRAVVRAAALKGERDAERARRASHTEIALRNPSRTEQRNSTRLTTALDTAAARIPATRSRIVVEPRPVRGGNYRTLCVRTCDGFFFPVSSAASPSDFARDERTCQMMCPGTETALYFHSARGQESEDMMSARTHEPYTDMPAAFAYRNASAPMSKACGCNMRAFHKEMARREAILNGTAKHDAPVTTWARPITRPDPGEDPESMMNADARLTSEDVAAVLAASRMERPLDQERRQVRMVGPTFLPEQAESLDLKAGAPRLFP